ncbi:MAG: nucleotidyl transferase AbiEii/AbiGii toxin family protein [Terracidiphilus sp.]
MTQAVPTNVAASVKQRLLNRARERKEDFNLLLTKYGLERILYRIGQSKYKDSFVLKGALLFELWTEQRYRPTRDADFLSIGDNSPERYQHIFEEICDMKVEDDGVRFDRNTVKVEKIKEDQDYEGLRVTFTGFMEAARLPVQIDIGFGDAVTPGPIETDFPTLLQSAAPRLLSYPRETVIAEKFEAMVKLGMANTRMKDFHDLKTLSELFHFESEPLVSAIQHTFERRKTALPVAEPPIALTEEFSSDRTKTAQWNAFVAKNKFYIQPSSLESVTTSIREFVMPLMQSEIQRGEGRLHWEPSKSWAVVVIGGPSTIETLLPRSDNR